MKHAYWYFVFFGILILLFPIGSSSIENYTFIQPIILDIPSSYTEHEPIEIICNQDFETQGWSGNGSLEQPYVIENLSIVTMDWCIRIQDTTSHFIIRNCFISSPNPTPTIGVHFQNVTHGSIQNCILEEHQDGLHLDTSSECSVINNTAINGYKGFHLDKSYDCNLTLNRATLNWEHGFSIRRSNNCALIDNVGWDNSIFGFHMETVSGILMVNNTADDNGKYGIYLEEAVNCECINNTIARNSQHGIYLTDSNQCTLNRNSIFDNSLAGIYLYQTFDCTLTMNTLNQNGLLIMGYSTFHWKHKISNNSVNGKPLGYLLEISDVTIDCTNYGQVVMVGCRDVNVSKGIFQNATCGFLSGFSQNCRVMDITSTSNSLWGFGLFYTDRFIISNDTANNNLQHGIHLQYSHACMILNNTLSSNTEAGFHLSPVSNRNNITHNIANNNGIGFLLSEKSESNTLYLNRIGPDNVQNAVDDGESNIWDDGMAWGNYWSDYDGKGQYNVSGEGHSVDRFPLSMGAVPHLSHPFDFECEFGVQGYSILWLAFDSDPSEYSVYMNESLISSKQWNGSDIVVYLQGLQVGFYVYKILAVDDAGNSAVDIVEVTVVDTTVPTVNSPTDIEYEAGSIGNTITWNTFDLAPSFFEIYRDGILIKQQPWNSTVISIVIDSLSAGTYSYSLTLYDESGNSISDEVRVIVTVITTETSTTTTYNTLYLSIILASGIVGVIIVLIVFRFKGKP